MATDLLCDLPWRFNRKRYGDVAAFVSDVEDYSRKILKREAPWSPDAVIIPESHIRLRYEAVRNDAYDDAFVELRTDADGFTAAEFLWKLHEALAEEELADHCFFEGVGRVLDGEPPLYAIFQGS